MLATKILRAWDNPSPPPSPPPEVAPASTSTPELDRSILAPINHGTQVLENATADNVLPQGLDEERPQLAGGAQPAATEFVPESVEEDLIIFDSFSSPSTAPRMRVMPATPLPSHDTVDDLLSLSPVPPMPQSEAPVSIPSAEGGVAQIIPNPSREDTPSVADEAEVAFALSTGLDVVTSTPVMPSDDAIDQPEPNISTPLVVLTPVAEPEPQTPTLRRSTRPKRSVSPFVPPLATPAKAMALSDSLAYTTPNASATRKRKAKTKDSDPITPPKLSVCANDKIETPPASRPPNSTIDVLLEELNNGILAQVDEQPKPDDPASELPAEGSAEPSATTSKPVAHRLGSLSPTSHVLLKQLLPCSDAPSGDDHNPSPTSDDAPPPPSSTEEQTTVFPGISIPTALPSTPQRPSAASKTADLTRTPARRVAISEAVAQGSLSPEKARNILAIARPSSSALNSTGSNFHSHAPNDPPRSPAKRVLIDGAGPTLQSPHKRKTPVRPSFDGRNRTSSSDTILAPALFSKVRRSASAEPTEPHISTFRRPNSTDGTTKLTEVTKPLPFPLVPRVPSTIVEADEQAVAPLPPPAPAVKPSSSLRQPTAKADSKIPRPGAKPYARPTPPGTSKSVSRLPAPATTKKVEPAVPSTAPVVCGLHLRVIHYLQQT